MTNYVYILNRINIIINKNKNKKIIKIIELRSKMIKLINYNYNLLHKDQIN